MLSLITAYEGKRKNHNIEFCIVKTFIVTIEARKVAFEIACAREPKIFLDLGRNKLNK